MRDRTRIRARVSGWALLAASLTLSSMLGAPAARAQGPAPAPGVELWEALGDAALARLVGEAVVANRDVAAARARVGGARAARLGAALERTPSVTASGGYSRQQLASPTFPGAAGRLPDQELWDAGLRASWDVDVFGRLRHTLRGRGELAAAADDDVQDARVLVAAQVAGAYFELRGAQDRLAVAARNAENQRGTLELTERRLEAGRGTALDTERARAQLSATLAAVPTLEAQVAAARYRLATLSGRRPAEFATTLAEAGRPLAFPEVASGVESDAVVRRRPDVRSAERQVAASSAFIGAARADYLPRLAVGAAAGYTGNALNAFGNTGTPRYVVGPVLSWPAFDVGRVRAGVEAARAEEGAARARYEQAVLRSHEEVETSLVAYRKVRERLRHLDDAAAASERAAELARLRYTEGASDFLQVLDAERTLLDRQDARALGQIEATAALVAVYRALGGARAFVAGAGR
jgi:NodT family efflux transporter outer membrane factor (OMF) lipoprotein